MEQWLPGAGGEENGDLSLSMEFQFGLMKKFWRWIVVMVAQQYKYI